MKVSCNGVKYQTTYPFPYFSTNDVIAEMKTNNFYKCAYIILCKYRFEIFIIGLILIPCSEYNLFLKGKYMLFGETYSKRTSLFPFLLFRWTLNTCDFNEIWSSVILELLKSQSSNLYPTFNIARSLFYENFIILYSVPLEIFNVENYNFLILPPVWGDLQKQGKASQIWNSYSKESYKRPIQKKKISCESYFLHEN